MLLIDLYYINGDEYKIHIQNKNSYWTELAFKNSSLFWILLISTTSYRKLHSNLGYHECNKLKILISRNSFAQASKNYFLPTISVIKEELICCINIRIFSYYGVPLLLQINNNTSKYHKLKIIYFKVVLFLTSGTKSVS